MRRAVEEGMHMPAVVLAMTSTGVARLFLPRRPEHIRASMYLWGRTIGPARPLELALVSLGEVGSQGELPPAVLVAVRHSNGQHCLAAFPYEVVDGDAITVRWLEPIGPLSVEQLPLDPVWAGIRDGAFLS
jgi:hypothetical protein